MNRKAQDIHFETKMEDLEIKDMKVVPCVESKFIKLARVVFKQNDCQRKWDYVKSHNSVAVLLFNTTRKAFILVKQFRPAVYMHINRNLHNPSHGESAAETEDASLPIIAPVCDGVTFELCAGIVDQDVTLETLARQEVLEECGYDVPEDKIQKITCCRSGVGISGSLQTLFYAEVTDEMQVGDGGGNTHEGEIIELQYLPVDEVREFLFDESKHKPSGLLFAFMWWFDKFKT